MKQNDVQIWLEQFCRGVPGITGALAVVATDQPGAAKLAAWPKEADRSPALAVAAKVALQSGESLSHVPPRVKQTAADSTEPARVIAAPFRDKGNTVAAVAVGVSSIDDETARQCRRKLQRAMESFGQPQQQTGSPGARASLRLLASLLQPARFDEAAVAAATELATLFSVDRVCIGWLRGRDTEVIAVSQGGNIDGNRQVFRAIGEAMDEAIAQREAIVYPPPADEPPRITQAHATLVKRQGGTVCSVPLASQGRLVGALLIEHGGAIVLDAPRRAFCEHVGTLIGSILELKYRAELPWRERIRRLRRSAVAKVTSGGHWGAKLAFVATVAALAAALTVPVPYRIGAPAHLEGATQRALVAPADGYLQQVHVRAGDLVNAEQVLVELADEELSLEKRRWQSELEQHENALGAALARADRAQMVVHQAKAEEARAQLELATQKMTRARVAAPFAGVVIRGDLEQRLGSPVKRGDLLLTVAPQGEFRIIVRVDERDIADVREDQRGSLVLAALPEHKFPIVVQRVTPLASSDDGRNVFEVEAQLSGSVPAALRPGLEGIAKIDAGEQSLAWIWGRRLVNWLQLALWSWGL